MAWDHNRPKQINTVLKLDKQNPDKYCWANLYLMSVETDSEEREGYKTAAKETAYQCQIDADATGRCWCGKFIKQQGDDENEAI